MSKPTKMVPIESISITVYVRTKYDENRMFHLAELYDAGVHIDPIIVTSDLELIDGRHRLEALRYLDRPEIEVIIDPSIRTKVALITAAFKANTGGSLPPSADDIDHTLLALMEEGVSTTKIVESMPFPPALTKKYLKSLKDKIAKRNMTAATLAVGNGMTVGEAAEQFDVDLDKLREKITGRRTKSKVSLSTMMSTLTARYRGHSQRNRKEMMGLCQMLEDGDITPDDAMKVLNKLEHLNSNLVKTANQWNGRIKVLLDNLKKKRSSEVD